MFPLKKRVLIRGCQAHINAGLGCGLDSVAATGTPLYAPFEGAITTYSGTQGGNWSRLTRINGDVIEMAHLSKYVITKGNVTEGQLIAYTGNTGSVTTGPHLHIQILRNGVRLDPDKYNWEENVILPPMTCEERLAQEKADHAESIKQKEENYQKWQTELENVHLLENSLAQEKRNHKETLERLQATEAEREKIVKERNEKFAKIREIVK